MLRHWQIARFWLGTPHSQSFNRKNHWMLCTESNFFCCFWRFTVVPAQLVTHISIFFLLIRQEPQLQHPPMLRHPSGPNFRCHYQHHRLGENRSPAHLQQIFLLPQFHQAHSMPIISALKGVFLILISPSHPPNYAHFRFFCSRVHLLEILSPEKTRFPVSAFVIAIFLTKIKGG